MGEYGYRPGTGENFGFEYENQMIAYLATAACNSEDLKDFWIASNIVGLGAWDDVIIYTETQNGKKNLQFLQLKHKANADIENKFKDWKDEFKKYARDYEQISSLLSYNVPNENQYRIKEILNKTGVEFEHFEFILLTNAAFKVHSRLLIKSKDSLIKTNNAGPIYQLSPIKTAVNTYNNFFNQFFIFSEQSGVNDKSLLNNVESQLKCFITHTNFKFHMEVAKYLLTLLKEWFLSKNRTLSATDVKEIICSAILFVLKHTKPVNSNCPILGKKEWGIFQKLIDPYQLVIYSNQKLTLENFFDERNRHYFIICKTSDVRFVINCIKLSKNTKVIMIVSNEILESIIETEIFTLNLLNTLHVDSLALLNDYDINIQGRKTKFELLSNQYSDIKNILKVDDILNLLLGELCIGEDCNFLSYYVPRSIPRVFVEKTIFIKMTNSIFIVIVEDNFEESELKIKCYLQSKLSDAETKTHTKAIDKSKTETKSNETNEKQFHFQCVKRDAFIKTLSNIFGDIERFMERNFCNVHILKYHEKIENFQLEWLHSFANIKEVKTFIDDGKYDLEQIGDNLNDICCNNVSKVIIVGNPGMGKTYFLKYMAINYPIDFWTVFITLNEIDFNKTVNFQSWLVEFYAKKLNLVDKKIFELYLKKKSVVVLFDGFDEVASDNMVNALNLIKAVIQEELKIVVTSREVTKEFLEKNLETIAFTLNPFSNKDKINYLKHFYLNNIKKPENLGMDIIKNRIGKFVWNFLENCSLCNWDEEFTGVPLQCRLLAEGFIEDCQRFSETEDLNNIPININVITLYEKFIESKFNIYWKEKENLVVENKNYKNFTKPHRNAFFSNHMDAAVQIIFPRVGIKISEKYIEEIKTANEKHGIIIGLDGNNNPVFIHRTFAEYFAAKWLVEIQDGKKELKEWKRKEYLRFLLEPQFNVVRDLFDRIVCKHCKLHSAILNADLPKVRDVFEKNGNRDDGKCGRNVLHLISARGARHEKRNDWASIERIEEEKYLEILYCFSAKSHWMVEEDNVLEWTPLKYANNRNAFGVIDILCGFDGSQLYYLNKLMKYRIEDILDMCLKYDYSNLGYGNVQDINIFNYSETKNMFKRCVENDSVRFAKRIIQSKGWNSQDLTSMTYTYCDEGLSEGVTRGTAAPGPTILGALTWLSRTFHPSSGNFVENLVHSYKGEKETLLHVAAKFGSIKILDVLLKYIGDSNITNSDGRTPLHVGCHYGHLSVVKALIKNGGNIFLLDNNGWTPLDRSLYSINTNREMIEYMTNYDVLKIGFGEDINAALPGKFGLRALHYSAMGRDMFTFSKLISEGANGHITDNEKNTVLHVMSEKHKFDVNIALRLIESGLDIDAHNSDGYTALHLAVLDGTKEYVQFLLQYGANTNAVDNKQRTALSLAREWGYNEIFFILWDKTQLKNERDAFHIEGLKMEARNEAFVYLHPDVSHLIYTWRQTKRYHFRKMLRHVKQQIFYTEE